MRRIVLAADVGGTNIRVAAVDRHGCILGHHKQKACLSDIPFSNLKEAEAWVLEQLEIPLRNMQKRFPDSQAAGIGFPGFFEGFSGVLVSSPNLPMLKNIDLSSYLSEQLGLPVLVQNDALTAAIGEFRFGSGEEHESLIHITMGTGVGGGLIVKGKPYPGDGGMAMEIGHLQVEKNGRQCGCGNRGCLEKYTSATAVAARYEELSGNKVEDAEDVHRLALDDDASARKVIEEAGAYLGKALADTVKLLDVRNISISGGLTSAWDMLLPPLHSALEDGLIPPMRGKVRLSLSTLGDFAGLLGASVLAFDKVIKK